MISFLVVFIGLSALVFVHELGHFVVAKGFGMLVEEFGIGFPPRLFSWKRGETRYSVNMIPLGGFVKLHGEFTDILPATDQPLDSRSFVRQAPWKRAVVLCAGVFMNFFAGWIILSSVFWIGVPPTIFINDVMPASPAAQAGIVPGDIVFGWSDIPAFISFINSHQNQDISFEVNRRGVTVPIRITPRIDPGLYEGALGVVVREASVPRQGFFAGLYHGFMSAWILSWSVLSGLYGIMVDPANIVGPVGIVNIAVSTGAIGFVYVLQLLGVISLNLSILNILPIPALDGGRLLFVIIEKVRGRPFTPHFENRVNAFGFAFLLGLIALVTVKDIAVFL